MSRLVIDRLGLQSLYEDAALLKTLLSTRYYAAGFGKLGIQNPNTYFWGLAVMAARRGILVPWDVEIIAYGITRASAGAGTVQIHLDGVSSYSIVMGANLTLYGTMSLDVDEGAVISGYWSSANTVTSLEATIYYRTRP